MEETDYHWYILFPNHTEGLRLSSALRQRGLDYTIAPTPRAVSRSCGISLIVNEYDLGLIQNMISDLRITIERVVRVPVKKDWRYRGI